MVGSEKKRKTKKVTGNKRGTTRMVAKKGPHGQENADGGAESLVRH
jgi:hypothetical protein